MSYQEKMYAVVIVGPDDDKRLFARIRRGPKGDFYVAFADDESPDNPAKGANAHASVHKDGRAHFKSSGQKMAVKHGSPPTKGFKGNLIPIVTNADCARATTLPMLDGTFDGYFYVPLNLLDGSQSQSFSFHLTEPGVEAANVSHKDEVLAKARFKDDEPWIVVQLTKPSGSRLD